MTNYALSIQQSLIEDILKFINEKQKVLPIDYFQVVADNFLNKPDFSLKDLVTVSKESPLSLHCVNMSIGGTDS